MWPRNKIISSSGQVSLPICSDCTKEVNEAEEHKPRAYLFGAFVSMAVVPFILLAMYNEVTSFSWPGWFIGASSDLYFSVVFLFTVAFLGNMCVPVLFVNAAKHLRDNKIRSPAEVFFNSSPSRGGAARFQIKNKLYYESFKQANPELTVELAPSFRGPPSRHFNAVGFVLIDSVMFGVIMIIAGMVSILAMQPILGAELAAFASLIPFAVLLVFKLLWTFLRGWDDQGKRIRYAFSDVAGLLLSLSFYVAAMVIISIAAGYGGSLGYIFLLAGTPIITFIIGYIAARFMAR